MYNPEGERVREKRQNNLFNLIQVFLFTSHVFSRITHIYKIISKGQLLLDCIIPYVFLNDCDERKLVILRMSEIGRLGLKLYLFYCQTWSLLPSATHQTVLSLPRE